MKTASEWIREGRIIRKGEHALFYRLSDDRTQGRALFDEKQTEPAGRADASDSWTIVVDAGEWEKIKAERREVQKRPRAKIRRGPDGGTEVWCGPNIDLINLLQHYGYTYNVATRYWFHPEKDAETTAKAFENGSIRGQKIRVARDWELVDGPVL